MAIEGDTTPEEQIAKSLIPYNRDDARARYLGLRSSGFSIREALKLIGKAKSTLSFWRLDPEFVALEERLPEFRKNLANEYAVLEFLRNFRLILEKDYRILRKSLERTTTKDGKTIDVALTEFEHQYLLKLRAFYTPQQLQVIEALAEGSSGDGGGFNFTEFILEATRTKDRVRIQTVQRREPILSVIDTEARIGQAKAHNPESTGSGP